MTSVQGMLQSAPVRQHVSFACYSSCSHVCLQGGTAAASVHLNDRNQADTANVLPDASSCDFLVGLAPKGRPRDLQGASALDVHIPQALMPVCLTWIKEHSRLCAEQHLQQQQ